MSDINYFGDEHLYWIATPDELEATLTEGGFHLLTVTRHVPLGYTEDPLTELTVPYRDLYGRLSAGEKPERGSPLLFPSFSPTRDPSRCVYGDEHTYRGKRYKSADPDYRDRCVHMDPFILYRETRKDGGFSIVKNCFYGLFPENAVGIHIYCPTKKQEWVDGAPIISLKDSPEYTDFAWMKEHVRSFTKPLKIQGGEQVLNTGIRVSEAAKQNAQSFYFFSQNGFSIL